MIGGDWPSALYINSPSNTGRSDRSAPAVVEMMANLTPIPVPLGRERDVDFCSVGPESIEASFPSRLPLLISFLRREMGGELGRHLATHPRSSPIYRAIVDDGVQMRPSFIAYRADSIPLPEYVEADQVSWNEPSNPTVVR